MLQALDRRPLALQWLSLPDVNKNKLNDNDMLKVYKWLDEMYGKNPGNILTKFVHWQISSPGDHHPAIGPWAAVIGNLYTSTILSVPIFVCFIEDMNSRCKI